MASNGGTVAGGRVFCVPFGSMQACWLSIIVPADHWVSVRMLSGRPRHVRRQRRHGAAQYVAALLSPGTCACPRSLLEPARCAREGMWWQSSRFDPIAARARALRPATQLQIPMGHCCGAQRPQGVPWPFASSRRPLGTSPRACAAPHAMLLCSKRSAASRWLKVPAPASAAAAAACRF